MVSKQKRLRRTIEIMALVIQWKAIMQNITEIHGRVIIRDLLPSQSNSKCFLMTLVVVSFCFLCSTSRILESFSLDGQQTPTLERETEKRSHAWSMRNSQDTSTCERSARSVIFGSQGTKRRKPHKKSNQNQTFLIMAKAQVPVWFKSETLQAAHIAS